MALEIRFSRVFKRNSVEWKLRLRYAISLDAASTSGRCPCSFSFSNIASIVAMFASAASIMYIEFLEAGSYIGGDTSECCAVSGNPPYCHRVHSRRLAARLPSLPVELHLKAATPYRQNLMKLIEENIGYQKWLFYDFKPSFSLLEQFTEPLTDCGWCTKTEQSHSLLVRIRFGRFASNVEVEITHRP